MGFFALKITNEVQSAKRKAQSEGEASLPNIVKASQYFGIFVYVNDFI